MFQLAVHSAATEMERAGELLAQGQTGNDPQRAQQQAIVRLNQLLAALKEGKSVSAGDQNQKNGDRPDDAQPPANRPPPIVHSVTEIKLLTVMQEDVNRRTIELQGQIGERAPIEAEAAELTSLAQEQGRIAEFVAKLTSVRKNRSLNDLRERAMHIPGNAVTMHAEQVIWKERKMRSLLTTLVCASFACGLVAVADDRPGDTPGKARSSLDDQLLKELDNPPLEGLEDKPTATPTSDTASDIQNRPGAKASTGAKKSEESTRSSRLDDDLLAIWAVKISARLRPGRTRWWASDGRCEASKNA